MLEESEDDHRSPEELIQLAGKMSLYEHLKARFGEDEQYKKYGLSDIYPFQYRELCEEMIRVATEYCIKEKIGLSDWYNYATEESLYPGWSRGDYFSVESADGCFSKALQIIEILDEAIQNEEPDEEHKYIWWRPQNIAWSASHGTIPQFDRAGVEGTVCGYLELPFRSRKMSKLLLEILVAMEIFAYGREIFLPEIRELPWLFRGWARRWSSSPIIQGHPLSRYVRALLVNLTFVAGTIALLVWLGNVNFIGGTTALWIGGIVVVLALLNVGYATVRLPFFWPNWSKAKSEIQEKWAAMLLAYAAFAGPALSIQHLRKLVEDSSQEGVVWPSTLFVLLDDLEKRGVQAV